MVIDLRSDTVTKPTTGMLSAMFSAPVGDDVFEEDPTVNALQEKAARMFGMEAALFCPSGTMTNQIAIKALTQPGDEVVCDALSHIYNFEGGGIAFNSLASVRLINGEKGKITGAQVLQNINPDNVHFPKTALVALENTVNKAGGTCYNLDEIAAVAKVCKANKLKLHLDGARIFNALVATGTKAVDYGKYFDAISICLSKGLGTPVGSLVLGNKNLIKQAKRIRKVLGGGWRQAGYLAAAGIYALDNHIQRLEEDHFRAKSLEAFLSKQAYIEEIIPAETNIVIFKLKNGFSRDAFVQHLHRNDIKVSTFGNEMVRLVTHLNFDDNMLEITLKALGEFKS